MDRLRQAGRRAPERRRSGMTLIEVMVAMGILAVGLLGLLAIQVEAMQSGRTGRHVTEAARIARDRMETFQRLDWGDADLQDTGGWAGPDTVDNTVTLPDGSTVTEQSFEVEWRIEDHATNTNLRFIDVRVTWSEGGGPNPEPKRYAVSSVRHNDPEI